MSLDASLNQARQALVAVGSAYDAAAGALAAALPARAVDYRTDPPTPLDVDTAVDDLLDAAAAALQLAHERLLDVVAAAPGLSWAPPVDAVVAPPIEE